MFHSLVIQKIQKETPNSVSIEFNIPANIQNEFDFQSGQFLTLKKEIAGEDIRRSYSICSTPKSGIVKVVVKQIPNGKFSTFANSELKEGDTIEAAKPTGTFFLTPNASNSKKYVLVAAGSGITPILSILKSILKEEPTSSIDLYYGNQNQQHTIFKNELEELKSTYKERLNLNFIFSQEKGESRFHSGRIEGRKIKKIFKKFSPIQTVSEVYMCGPQDMVESIKNLLVYKLDFPAQQIHFELFTASTTVSKPASSTPGKSTISALIDGKDVEFQTEKGESILEAGLKAGNDIPFSCQGGVCGACKCIVISGDAEMDMNLALSDDEVQAGYSLACQTKVSSTEAKVSFDF